MCDGNVSGWRWLEGRDGGGLFCLKEKMVFGVKLDGWRSGVDAAGLAMVWINESIGSWLATIWIDGSIGARVAGRASFGVREVSGVECAAVGVWVRSLEGGAGAVGVGNVWVPLRPTTGPR